jgi:hypothetical protein
LLKLELRALGPIFEYCRRVAVAERAVLLGDLLCVLDLALNKLGVGWDDGGHGAAFG